MTSVAVIVVAAFLGSVAGRVLAHRATDTTKKYYVRKVTHYVLAAICVVALALLWRPFAGQLGLVLGLMTAGLAFAMQEVIGAIAGWFNVTSGAIYRIGDRVQLGGIRGDVIDITPMRTKLMEIGSGTDQDTWVRGRQYTGRIVAVSNKATLTDPVFNYSGSFEFIWEELTVPIAYRDNWREAERILTDEAEKVSVATDAEAAISSMTRHYPIAKTDVEPRVYVRATDNYLELTARFVVPVRTAHTVKNQITQEVLVRLEAAGIPIASQTQDLTVRVEPEKG
ncbi:MAG: mechanosensitive ion channel family protein [Acidimicrobiia bacterium]|nr:mechanosensitive ion channel family protein [Acidimicrobiia bacterium]